MGMRVRRIAILTHDLDGGAFTNLGTALARGFQALGVECDLVVLNPSPAVRARFSDLNVVSLGVGRTSLALLAVVRYLRERRPDVLLPMPWYFNILAVWARGLARVPTRVVMGEHNIISLEAGVEFRHRLRLRFLPILMRWTYPYAQGLVAVCQDTLTDLHRTLRIQTRCPEMVIYNPLDVERVQALAQMPLDHPWFEPGAPPVILTTARLARQKNLDALIRAVAMLRQRMEVRLLILGEGPLRNDLEALCGELGMQGQVELPGYVDNPYRFMARCAVFVLASAWEGCPVAMEEAMACAAPIVATDAPGGAKEILDQGRYGMVVPHDDLYALADALERMTTEATLSDAFRQGALEHAQSFHYLRIASQYLKFCNAIVHTTQSQSQTQAQPGQDAQPQLPQEERN
jgi:glycosyltransferase involved in cell wall biosynthesis